VMIYNIDSRRRLGIRIWKNW